MYPFSNNCYQTPIPYDIHRQASNGENNPSPQSEDYFFNIPYSPSIHYTDEVNEQTRLQLQDIVVLQSVTNDDKTASNKASPNERKSKSHSKTDRHSKIRTAQGLRDRRMRLSLDVARKLFDLQDSLGFDKASKTVEWLLTKSDTAIKEMEGGLLQHTTTYHQNQLPSVSENEKMKSHLKEEKKAKVQHISKETRKNARERARERTIEKRRKVGESKVYFGGMDCDYTGLESQSTVTENLCAQDQKLPWERSCDTVDDSLLFSGNSSTCAVCFYQ